MSALSHITLGSNDTKRSGRFFDEVLGILGFSRLPKPPGKRPACEQGGMPTIYIFEPIDGRPATWGNGTQTAFLAETRGQVRAFHEAALRLGGQTEGEPGLRPRYSANYYAPMSATPTATSCRPCATPKANKPVRPDPATGSAGSSQTPSRTAILRYACPDSGSLASPGLRPVQHGLRPAAQLHKCCPPLISSSAPFT